MIYFTIFIGAKLQSVFIEKLLINMLGRMVKLDEIAIPTNSVKGFTLSCLAIDNAIGATISTTATFSINMLIKPETD